MINKSHFKKLTIPIFLLGLFFFTKTPQVYANQGDWNRHGGGGHRDNGGGHWDNHHWDHRPHYRPRPYFYYPRPVYRPPAIIFRRPSLKIIIGSTRPVYYPDYVYRPAPVEYVVVPPPVGSIVASLPAGAQSVVIEGGTYYIKDGGYYRDTTSGYAVMPAPQAGGYGPQSNVLTTAQANSDDGVTVNVPDSKGGYVAVILHKSGDGYLGPQGEYYPSFPKVDQLQAMYVK